MMMSCLLCGESKNLNIDPDDRHTVIRTVCEECETITPHAYYHAPARIFRSMRQGRLEDQMLAQNAPDDDEVEYERYVTRWETDYKGAVWRYEEKVAVRFPSNPYLKDRAWNVDSSQTWRNYKGDFQMSTDGSDDDGETGAWTLKCDRNALSTFCDAIGVDAPDPRTIPKSDPYYRGMATEEYPSDGPAGPFEGDLCRVCEDGELVASPDEGDDLGDEVPLVEGAARSIDADFYCPNCLRLFDAEEITASDAM